MWHSKDYVIKNIICKLFGNTKPPLLQCHLIEMPFLMFEVLWEIWLSLKCGCNWRLLNVAEVRRLVLLFFKNMILLFTFDAWQECWNFWCYHQRTAILFIAHSTEDVDAYQQSPKFLFAVVLITTELTFCRPNSFTTADQFLKFCWVVWWCSVLQWSMYIIFF